MRVAECVQREIEGQVFGSLATESQESGWYRRRQSDRKRARRSVLVCAVAWVPDCCSGVVSCHSSQWGPCDASHLPVHAVAQELCLPSVGQSMFKITLGIPLSLLHSGFGSAGATPCDEKRCSSSLRLEGTANQDTSHDVVTIIAGRGSRSGRWRAAKSGGEIVDRNTSHVIFLLHSAHDDVCHTTWLTIVFVRITPYPWSSMMSGWLIVCSLLCSSPCSFPCVSPSPCSSLPTSTCTLSWTPSSMWTTPRQ